MRLVCHVVAKRPTSAVHPSSQNNRNRAARTPDNKNAMNLNLRIFHADDVGRGVVLALHAAGCAGARDV